MVVHALNLLDRANWRVTPGEPGKEPHYEYIMPAAEAKHLQALEESAPERLSDIEIESKLSLAIDNPARSSGALVAAGLEWADRLSRLGDVPEESGSWVRKHAQRVIALILMRDGEPAQREKRKAWDLGDCSEPEPDLVILKPRADDYARAHPQVQDVLLLIEVADSSLAFDQGTKRDLYARFGVGEYRVVDISHERVVAYRRPLQGVFQQIEEYRSDEEISPQSFLDIRIPVRELLAR
jgi:hypothetical protein